MDQNELPRRIATLRGCTAVESFEPGANAILSGGTSDHRLCKTPDVGPLQGRQHLIEQDAIVRVNDRDDRRDIGTAEEGEKRASQQWLARQRPILLGQAITGSRPASRGNNQHMASIRHPNRAPPLRLCPVFWQLRQTASDRKGQGRGSRC